MRRYPLGLFSVSRIGFGAMQLPGPGVFGPPRDRAEALAVLRRAVELGVDHIDTAQYYGPDVANGSSGKPCTPTRAPSRW
jgi:pyridoxine 4-dehydrogenase